MFVPFLIFLQKIKKINELLPIMYV